MNQPAQSPIHHESSWRPIEGNAQEIVTALDRPLERIAHGEVPALVLRKAYPRASCAALVSRLIDRELLYDPSQPVPEHLREQSIPEGYVRLGLSDESTRDLPPADATATGKRRIDIGTSLGYRGSNPEEFFAHSAETHALFGSLLEGLDDPVETIYSNLSRLSTDARAVTAYEPDGRRYGPAIFRAHYGDYSYHPHFDSVRLREKRESYAVHRFEHQFAGVLVLQNAERDDKSAQCTINRQLWEPEIDTHLEAGTFHQYAKENSIESCRVVLEPGDLYFFNTRAIHEVPGLAGDLPRIVLATFIGYSTGDPEIFVWS